MRKFRKLIITCVVVLPSFCLSASAAPRNNFYIQQAIERYFPVPSDARSLATGGATNLQCRGSACTYLNPAGLGFMRDYEVLLTAGTGRFGGDDFLDDDRIEQDQLRGNLNFAIPLGELTESGPRYGTLTLAYSRYKGDTDDALNSTPDGHTRTVGYAFAPSDDLSFGYTFVFYDDQLHTDVSDLHSHARILHLLGTQYKLDNDTTIGGLVAFGGGQSDTEDYTVDSNGLSKPRQFTGALGITRRDEANVYSVAADYNHLKNDGNLGVQDVSKGVVYGGDEEGDFFDVRFGYERELGHGITGMAGTRWYDVTSYDFKREDVKDLSGSFSGVGFSLGIGYEFDKSENVSRGIQIAYGLEYLTALDGQWDQKVSLILPF